MVGGKEDATEEHPILNKGNVFPGLRQCFGPAGQRDAQPHRHDMGDQELGLRTATINQTFWPALGNLAQIYASASRILRDLIES
jgi:hypothetical protein